MQKRLDDFSLPPAPRGAAAPGWHSGGFWRPEPEVWILGLWHLRRCEPSLSLETRIFLPGYSQTKCSTNGQKTFPISYLDLVKKIHHLSFTNVLYKIWES